ncbi:MAG: ABC transporter ATP-binding protein [Fusicatenibacter sp.]
MEELIRLENVKNFFSVEEGLLKAVNGVSLTIHKGESVGLVGESGCGKSTLGRVILRLYRPVEGNLYYKGRDIWTYKKKEVHQYRKNVQMIFQDPYASLDPLFVVRDILAEGIDAHHLYKGKEREERIDELLSMVGLNREHGNRFPHEFSGGQRQRIGIARALSVEPELIVCDEPISALDVSIQAQIVNLLKSLQEKMGLSYLFITHDLSMVRQISDRIAVMYLGAIVEIAPSEEIYTNCCHPYTKALLSAIPIADPDVEKERSRICLNGDVPSPVNLPKGCSFCGRCPYANEQCSEEKPELAMISPGHYAACHRAQELA